LGKGKLGLSLNPLVHELISTGPQLGHLRPDLSPLGPELLLTSAQFGYLLS